MYVLVWDQVRNSIWPSDVLPGCHHRVASLVWRESFFGMHSSSNECCFDQASCVLRFHIVLFISIYLQHILPTSFEYYVGFPSSFRQDNRSF